MRGNRQAQARGPRMFDFTLRKSARQPAKGVFQFPQSLARHFNILTDYRQKVSYSVHALADRPEQCFACAEAEGKP